MQGFAFGGALALSSSPKQVQYTIEITKIF